MNIESQLWKLVSLNDGYVMITQKASNTTRMIVRGRLPSLAIAHEKQFDKICREAFHQ